MNEQLLLEIDSAMKALKAMKKWASGIDDAQGRSNIAFWAFKFLVNAYRIGKIVEEMEAEMRK